VILQKVLTKDLGADWKDKFRSFDSKPFAAASIGQVHYATLHDGRQVAVKIQVNVVYNMHFIVCEHLFLCFKGQLCPSEHIFGIISFMKTIIVLCMFCQ